MKNQRSRRRPATRCPKLTRTQRSRHRAQTLRSRSTRAQKKRHTAQSNCPRSTRTHKSKHRARSNRPNSTTPPKSSRKPTAPQTHSQTLKNKPLYLEYKLARPPHHFAAPAVPPNFAASAWYTTTWKYRPVSNLLTLQDPSPSPNALYKLHFLQLHSSSRDSFQKSSRSSTTFDWKTTKSQMVKIHSRATRTFHVVFTFSIGLKASECYQ